MSLILGIGGVEFPKGLPGQGMGVTGPVGSRICSCCYSDLTSPLQVRSQE